MWDSKRKKNGGSGLVSCYLLLETKIFLIDVIIMRKEQAEITMLGYSFYHTPHCSPAFLRTND